MARFLKNRKQSNGTAPGSLIFIGKQKVSNASIKVFEYCSEFIRESDHNSFERVEECVSDNHMTWISLHGLHNTELIDQMGKIFEVPSLILEDILNTDQRPRFSEDEDHLFIILKTLVYNKETRQIDTEQVSFIVGRRYLISIQENSNGHFDDVLKRLFTPKSRIRNMGADYLCYALIDSIVDGYILNIEEIGVAIEELDKVLLTANTSVVQDIYHYKTELSFARKNVRPVKEITTRFNNSNSDLINDSTIKYLHDLDDLMVQSLEAIEIYYTMISDQQNVYATNINNRVNDVMKVLTIFSTIFIPLTFIAGVYGMNFDHIPELRYHYSYFILWGVMITIVIVMLFYFKRKKWL